MEFSQQWVSQWSSAQGRVLQIRRHLEVAAELGRPFLLGEFGKQRPIAQRNAFLKMVHAELKRALDLDYPVAGPHSFHPPSSVT